MEMTPKMEEETIFITNYQDVHSIKVYSLFFKIDLSRIRIRFKIL